MVGGGVAGRRWEASYGLVTAVGQGRPRLHALHAQHLYLWHLYLWRLGCGGHRGIGGDEDQVGPGAATAAALGSDAVGVGLSWGWVGSGGWWVRW